MRANGPAAVALGSALVLGAAVAGLTSFRGAPDGTPPPRVGDTLPVMIANADVWLALPTLKGSLVNLGALRGSPLLVNLWATWCPACSTEVRYLQELHSRYASTGLRVLGISVDSRFDGGTVSEFVRENGVSYDVLLDPSRSSLQRFGVVGLPSTFVVDREGVVRLVRVGLVKEGDDAFERAVRAALGCFDPPDRTCEL